MAKEKNIITASNNYIAKYEFARNKGVEGKAGSHSARNTPAQNFSTARQQQIQQQTQEKANLAQIAQRQGAIQAQKIVQAQHLAQVKEQERQQARQNYNQQQLQYINKNIENYNKTVPYVTQINKAQQTWSDINANQETDNNRLYSNGNYGNNGYNSNIWNINRNGYLGSSNQKNSTSNIIRNPTPYFYNGKVVWGMPEYKTKEVQKWVSKATKEATENYDKALTKAGKWYDDVDVAEALNYNSKILGIKNTNEYGQELIFTPKKGIQAIAKPAETLMAVDITKGNPYGDYAQGWAKGAIIYNLPGEISGGAMLANQLSQPGENPWKRTKEMVKGMAERPYETLGFITMPATIEGGKIGIEKAKGIGLTKIQYDKVFADKIPTTINVEESLREFKKSNELAHTQGTKAGREWESESSRAGLKNTEDAVTYHTPKGKASTVGLRKSGITNDSSKFTFDPLENRMKGYGEVDITKTKGVTTYPKKILNKAKEIYKIKGREEAFKYLNFKLGELDKTKAYITLRSTLGHTKELEAGTIPQKISRIIDGNWYQKLRGYKEYTEIGGKHIPIKKYELASITKKIKDLKELRNRQDVTTKEAKLIDKKTSQLERYKYELENRKTNLYNYAPRYYGNYSDYGNYGKSYITQYPTEHNNYGDYETPYNAEYPNYTNYPKPEYPKYPIGYTPEYPSEYPGYSTGYPPITPPIVPPGTPPPITPPGKSTGRAIIPIDKKQTIRAWRPVLIGHTGREIRGAKYATHDEAVSAGMEITDKTPLDTFRVETTPALQSEIHSFKTRSAIWKKFRNIGANTFKEIRYNQFDKKIESKKGGMNMLQYVMNEART